MEYITDVKVKKEVKKEDVVSATLPQLNIQKVIGVLVKEILSPDLCSKPSQVRHYHYMAMLEACVLRQIAQLFL